MLPLLIGAGIVGLFIFASMSPGVKEGDQFQITSPQLGGTFVFVLQKVGPGLGWVPMLKNQFPAGTLAAFPNGTHKWFPGLGAFVKT